ncbi:MAG: prenyltransferase [Candidatus Latescibacterota bacterium]|nr:MAG: prenyltransferase [Candidatus Latescibacterota bacterium]
MRPPFLLLTPACVVLGLATAVWSSDEVSASYFLLALVGAVCAHISVNAFNEYWDFKSGLDSKTKRTPFSGGSGTLPARPELARWPLGIASATFALTCLIGVYFLRVRGVSVLPFGLIGLLVVATYTTRITRMPFLCLIAPGLGFGWLMVGGTDFVLTGDYSWTAFFASCVPFFLVSDLLLLNQFPDVEADRSVGRRHYPILIGRRASSLIYGAFLLCAFLSIVLGVRFGYLPSACLIGLIALVPAVPAFVGARRYADDVTRLIPFMSLNVLITIATPVLVAMGLFWG